MKYYSAMRKEPILPFAPETHFAKGESRPGPTIHIFEEKETGGKGWEKKTLICVKCLGCTRHCADTLDTSLLVIQSLLHCNVQE